MQVTPQEVVKVIQKVKTVDEPSYDFDVRLREDLGLDSLDYITAIFELERAFNIEIPQDFEVPETLNKLTEEINKLKLCKPT